MSRLNFGGLTKPKVSHSIEIFWIQVKNLKSVLSLVWKVYFLELDTTFIKWKCWRRVHNSDFFGNTCFAAPLKYEDNLRYEEDPKLEDDLNLLII